MDTGKVANLGLSFAREEIAHELTLAISLSFWLSIEGLQVLSRSCEDNRLQCTLSKQVLEWRRGVHVAKS